MARVIVILSESQRLRDIMRAALAGDGHQVIGFTPGSVDLDAHVARKPDLVILDWFMGLEDQGLQVLQTLKLYDSFAEVPVIVCSAPSPLVRGLRSQLHHVKTRLLCKPFSLADLRTEVESAFLVAVTAEDEESLVATSSAAPALAPVRLRPVGEPLPAGYVAEEDATLPPIDWPEPAPQGATAV